MNDMVVIGFKNKNRAVAKDGTGSRNWEALRNPRLPLPLCLSPAYLLKTLFFANHLSLHLLEHGYVTVYVLLFLPQHSISYTAFEIRFQTGRQQLSWLTFTQLSTCGTITWLGDTACGGWK